MLLNYFKHKCYNILQKITGLFINIILFVKVKYTRNFIMNNIISLYSVTLFNKYNTTGTVINDSNVIKLVHNNQLKWNHIVNVLQIPIDDSYLEIRYKINNDFYKILFEYPNNIVYPIYTHNELVNSYNTRFTNIIGASLNNTSNIIDIIKEYAGPMHNFYTDKNITTNLKNITYKNEKIIRTTDFNIVIEDNKLNSKIYTNKTSKILSIDTKLV
jgi:hypothetical protein